MKIGEILNSVYDTEVGWRPASGAIKPVHVANGLIRAIQGTRYDPSRLHEFIVWWQRGKKKPDEGRSFEALLEKHPHIYEYFTKDFERARRYAQGLLGGDDALFPSIDQSSFSLTSGLMVTRDSNDRRLGLFAAALMGDHADSESLAAAVLSASSTDAPRDPLTALVWPLLDGTESKTFSGGLPASRVKHALTRRHNRQFVAMMSEAACCLATHERAQGNPMRTLQRAVQLACMATLVHAQTLAVEGQLCKRPPALVTLGGQRRSEIALASERSLDLLFRKFEEWLAQRLGVLIRQEKPLVEGADPLPSDTTDLRALRHVFANIGPAGQGESAPSDVVVRERMHYYRQARQLAGDHADPADILGQALVDAYVREFSSSGGPRRFLQGLGCRIGLLYPHFGGRAKHKRYRPSVSVLDTLVRACVPAGESVSLSVFLERLWERFGLLVGGRRDESWDDADFLVDHDLPIDIPALVENTEWFIDELVAMGLARRYADDVTFVGEGHE